MFPPFARVIIGAPVWIGHLERGELEIDPASGWRNYQLSNAVDDTEAARETVAYST
jgi:hypothetical protein